MTSEELIKRINGIENSLTLWKAVHSSPGYAHQMELLNKLKLDEQAKNVFCAFVGWDRQKLNEMLATISNELLLGDQIADGVDSDVAFLNKLKGHPALIWGIAALLG